MSEMLDKYQVFNEMYRALVSAGETAGYCKHVRSSSKIIEKSCKIKGQIKSALAYPSAIAILTVIIVFIMMLLLFQFS